MPTKTTGYTPFKPRAISHARRPPPATFQAHLDIGGELGRRALAARNASGLTTPMFVQACIEYALDNMETE